MIQYIRRAVYFLKQFISIGIADPGLLLQHIIVFCRKQLHASPELNRDGLYQKHIEGVALIIDGKVYPKVARDVSLGAYETTLIKQLPKFIRKGDIVCDVGGNLGIISAHMMALVGKQGEVHSFEPVAEYFKQLRKIQQANPSHKLYINHVALGDRKEQKTIYLTSSESVGVNSFFHDFIPSSEWKSHETAVVITLSDYLKGHGIDEISLLKIDVEGYGLPVLKGATEFLSRTQKRPVIILELSEQTFNTPGFSLEETYNFVSELGYESFKHNNLKKRVDIRKITQQSDVVLTPRS
tara:strand:- start:1451 stop:2338 length:888 start_codon:yes stop_codon:yes gene_type:complete